MKIRYSTDSGSGEIEAASLADALDAIDDEQGVTDMLHDGAWAWVEDEEGNRLYLGKENV